MPRKTRMYLAGMPAHVVQRGNIRRSSFFCPDDFLYYQYCLGEGLGALALPCMPMCCCPTMCIC